VQTDRCSRRRSDGRTGCARVRSEERPQAAHVGRTANAGRASRGFARHPATPRPSSANSSHPSRQEASAARTATRTQHEAQASGQHEEARGHRRRAPSTCPPRVRSRRRDARPVPRAPGRHRAAPGLLHDSLLRCARKSPPSSSSHPSAVSGPRAWAAAPPPSTSLTLASRTTATPSSPPRARAVSAEPTSSLEKYYDLGVALARRIDRQDLSDKDSICLAWGETSERSRRRSLCHAPGELRITGTTPPRPRVTAEFSKASRFGSRT
jgi:hypothetical protein